MRIHPRRLLVATFIAGALVPAATAQAAPSQERCDVRLERIEDRFREIEERRGYDAAVAWWDARWARYHERCVIGA
jgi:hypothetical protein